jgi:phage tail sheath protein FI
VSTRTVGFLGVAERGPWQTKNRFAILSSTSHEPLPFGISFDSKYAAYYYPWVNVINSQTGQKVLITACGHLAGIYARTDDAVGVQQTPANQQILGIDSLQLTLTDQQQALLNPIGINALRYFKGYGNLVWGGRTTSLDPDWKYMCAPHFSIRLIKAL